MRLAYYWPMRWKTRSAPVRSTRAVTPGYLASKALATFSASGRSTDVYQTTLPSRRAASINCGVMEAGSGGAALSGDANVLAARAAVPCNNLRLESRSDIAILPVRRGRFFCPRPKVTLRPQRAAALERHLYPDLGALRDVLARRCHNPQLGAVGEFHHIVAA